jgi:hypothetical protein
MKNILLLVCLFASTFVSCKKDKEDGGYTTNTTLIGRWNIISVDTRVYDRDRLIASQTDNFGEGDYWNILANGTINSFLDGVINKTGKWQLQNNGKKLVLIDENNTETPYDIQLHTAGGSLRLYQEVTAGSQIARITSSLEKEK